MPDYIYSIKPKYPIRETISFLTDAVEFDSITHAPVGSPATFQTTTNMPKPVFPIEETTIRESLISDLQDKKFEQSRVRHEKSIRSYLLNFKHMTLVQRNALVNFFVARKGKLDNFYIQYPEIFDGASTLVRFTQDALEISIDEYQIFSAAIEIKQAVNGQYSSKWAGARREYRLPYEHGDLDALTAWYEATAIGRSGKFTFDIAQIESYMTGPYTCRLRSDDLLQRQTKYLNKTIEIELIETV